MALVVRKPLYRMHSFALLSFIVSINLINAQLLKPIDLTWSFENSTIYYPGTRHFEFTKKVGNITEGNFWVAMNEFCTAEHGGTHLDAPYHFNEKGRKVGEIPLERLIAPGVLIDISDDAQKRGSMNNLEVHHLTKWQNEHGQFENNTVVLIKFGWSKYYHDRNVYLGLDENGNPKDFPGISKEAAQWLVDTKRVVGVGVDVASIDPGVVAEYEAHRVFCANDLYLLENIKLLENMPHRNFTLVVMPMHIAEGTGAPLRLIAI